MLVLTRINKMVGMINVSEGFGINMKIRTGRGKRIPRTGYHLVDPSPWPVMVRAGALNEAAAFISFVHNGSYTLANFLCAT